MELVSAKRSAHKLLIVRLLGSDNVALTLFCMAFSAPF